MYVVIPGTRCKSGKAWSETLYVDVGMGMPGRSGTACAHAHVLYTTCPRHLYYTVVIPILSLLQCLHSLSNKFCGSHSIVFRTSTFLDIAAKSATERG